MDERGSARTDPVVKLPYIKRQTCRICGHNVLDLILDLGRQYVANFTRSKNVGLPEAPLRLVRCTGCGTLQLEHSINPDIVWREYWYRSSINQTMRDALADVVRDGEHYARDGVWLDIGANDGYLLSRVGQRYTKIACEPALNLHALLEEHADHIIPDYFTAEAALKVRDSYDVITSCAMFYDLDDPGRFVADIALCLAPGGVWINQLNDAPTMLERNAFDAICHEHRLYLDVPTIEKLYRQHGLAIVGLSYNDVNGGSIRIAAMKSKPPINPPTLGIPKTDPEAVTRFGNRVRRWKTIMRELIDLPSYRNQEIWGLGASTKGCCMLQYLHTPDRFVAIGDRNPAKWGTFQAGTWIAVLDEATMRKAKPKLVIPLIWAFRKEVIQREADMLKSGTEFLMPLPHPEIIT